MFARDIDSIGSHDSGKSTIMKQMLILFGGGYTKA